MAMGNVLQAAMAAGRQPAAMNPSPSPPKDGLPPAPTGVGAVPTGDPGTTAKGAADQVVLAVRELLGFFPALAPQGQAFVDAVKAAAQSGGKPKAAIGQPSPPGTPPPEVPASPLSGGPGPL